MVGDGWVITWWSGLAPPLAIDHVLVDRSTGVVAELRLPAD